MLRTASIVIKDCVTGKDGESYDIGRITVLIGCIAMIAMQGWSTYLKGVFDAQSFGIGFAAIIGGGCAGIGWKAHTEPSDTIEGMPRDR